MKLSTALAMVTGGEKTASVRAPESTPAASASSDAGDRLRQALKEATAPEATKTAAQTSPVEALTKIASDLSEAEHEALKKEAQLYGAAVCDGFMARAAQYAEATNKTAGAPTKTAGDDSFEKFATENPDLVKEAAEQGYRSAFDQLNKLAEAAYVKGYDTTVAQIHKYACDAFVAGFKDVAELMEASR
jgi:hypothetical protein